MRLTESQLKNMVKQELRKVLRENTEPAPELKQKEKDLVARYAEIDFGSTSPSEVLSDLEMGNINDIPDSFIATSTKRYSDMGFQELWVGHVGNVEATSKDPKTRGQYEKYSANISNSFYVIEHLGWNSYEAGPFQTFEQAQQAGLAIAKKNNMINRDQIITHYDLG